MKRARARLGSFGLGGVLVLGSFVARGDASPLVTHRPAETVRGTETETIALPSCSSLPVPGFSARPGREDPLDLQFEPGIESALESPLPSPLAGDAERPGMGPPPGEAPGRIEALAPAPALKKQTVPEPASIVLVVTGLIGLAARRHLLRNRV